ncbi:periplasmic heavy metal sensor [bacterium]|nr:periplasmic heavy metal sensor [bacterium]
MEVLFKQRAAAWMILLLLVLNVATLSTLWYRELRRPDFRPPRFPGRQDNVAQFLKEELQWSDSQAQAFERLRSAHQERVRSLMGESMELRRQLLDGLFEAAPDSAAAAELLRQISLKQGELETQNYSYFLALKQLCGSDQTDRLRRLMTEVIFHDHPGGGPGGLPGGGPLSPRDDPQPERRPDSPGSRSESSP